MKTRAIRGTRRRKGGFSLIEVMVAMAFLSLILISLARVTFQMAAASRTADIVAKRNATLIEEANKFNAVQFSSIPSIVTTTVDLKYGDFKFQRRLEVTTNTSSWYTIKIVITPYIGGILTTSKKDSVFVQRAQPAGSPLCTSGC
jgi:prepilin-type N-terminal cleavage/methylation domain-containing protein